MPGWMHSLYAASTVLACLLLAGCGKDKDKKSTTTTTAGTTTTTGSSGNGGSSKITKANFEKVKDNMSEKDVTEILGTPSSSKDIQDGKEHSWKNGNNKIDIGIIKGKVEYKSSQFVN